MTKRWREYTTEEITRLKEKQCVKCEYYSHGGGGRDNIISGTCDYILIHKHSRGCPPYECVERGIFKPREKRNRRGAMLRMQGGALE